MKVITKFRDLKVSFQSCIMVDWYVNFSISIFWEQTKLVELNVLDGMFGSDDYINTYIVIVISVQNFNNSIRQKGFINL